MGMLRIVRCTDAERIAYGGIEPGRQFYCTDTETVWIGSAAGDVRVGFYEVGDWTPAITFGGAAVGVTYGANNAGRYVRFGDWVSITGRLQLTSKGVSVGGVLITPLPFTCKNVDGAWTPVNMRLNVITFSNQWVGFIAANTLDITVGEQTVGGVYTDLTNADFANNSVVMIGATYEIET